MTVMLNSATATNIFTLQKTSELFQISQKRVSTGKQIFSATDDSARYRLSETMLGRNRQLGAVNNNIALALKALESTDNTLKNIIGLVEQAQSIVRQAQAEGSTSTRAIQLGGNVNATSNFAATPAGNTIMRTISITSEGGGTFVHTIPKAGDLSVGAFVNALNASGIGVVAEFVQNGATTNIRLTSTNGKDFRIDGSSNETAISSIFGTTTVINGTTYAAANINNAFANNNLAPAAAELGITAKFGGSILTSLDGAQATDIFTAGGTLVFEDGEGATRSVSVAAGGTLQNLMDAINNLGSGIRAELTNIVTGAATNGVRFQLRNTKGGNMKITAATGDFTGTAAIGATANLGFTASGQIGVAPSGSVNATVRQTLSANFDAIRNEIDQVAINNAGLAGRNLLRNESFNVVLNEQGGTAMSQVNISGTTVTNVTLGITAANFTSDTTISNSITTTNNALTRLRDLQSQFAAFNSYIKSRMDLNKAYANDLNTVGNDLVAADVTEESANLLALQTRQSFAVQSLSMGSQTEQSLLRLFG